MPTLAPMMLTRPLIDASWRSFWSADRPRAGPYWLQLVWTGLFSAALAVPFTVLGFVMYGGGRGAWRNLPGWIEWYGRNLVVSMTIGLITHFLFLGLRQLIGSARLRAMGGWQRTVYYATVPLIAVVLGLPVGFGLVSASSWQDLARRMDANAVVGSVLLSLTITMILHFYWRARSREVEAQARATEAQLRLLQAQIEPHFLFNTLANVQSLIDYDTPRAKQMLEAFTDYLRASLGQLRHDDSSLAAELEMAQSYLQLLQTRMGERLRFVIEADARSSSAVLPPLLLQPLIENAIHHGLEPKIDGGTVRISARVVGEQLQVCIDDDGLGLDAPRRPGKISNGVALENVRARLLTRYASTAALRLEALPIGTRAVLTLPFTAKTDSP